MQHSTLLFRYVERNIFGIEVHKNGQKVTLVLRQPDKATIRKTITVAPTSVAKR